MKRERASLNGSPIIVDTGDEAVDELFSGYLSVTTGYGQRAIYKFVPLTGSRLDPGKENR